MYVPPIVKKKVDELGIGRGELFAITKAEKKNGTRRTIEWVVATDGCRDRKPQRREQQPNGTAPTTAPRQAPRSAPANGNWSQGRVHSAMPKAFLLTGHGQFLLQALAAAVDVAAATETLCGRVRVWNCSSPAETYARSGWAFF